MLADDGARSEHSPSEHSSDHARVNTVDVDEAEGVIDLNSDDDDYDEEEGPEDEGDSDNDTASSHSSHPSPKKRLSLKAQTSLISIASSEAPSCSSRPVRPAAVSLEISASSYK